jgi:hypothetical protein
VVRSLQKRTSECSSYTDTQTIGLCCVLSLARFLSRAFASWTTDKAFEACNSSLVATPAHLATIADQVKILRSLDSLRFSLARESLVQTMDFFRARLDVYASSTKKHFSLFNAIVSTLRLRLPEEFSCFALALALSTFCYACRCFMLLSIAVLFFGAVFYVAIIPHCCFSFSARSGAGEKRNCPIGAAQRRQSKGSRKNSEAKASPVGSVFAFVFRLVYCVLLLHEDFYISLGSRLSAARKSCSCCAPPEKSRLEACGKKLATGNLAAHRRRRNINTLAGFSSFTYMNDVEQNREKHHKRENIMESMCTA